MIAKLTGALLLALGGGYLCMERIGRRRREVDRCCELAAALESIEGMIRWEKAALPVAIERQCSRINCGEIFSEILDAMKSKTALQDAWKNSFSKFTLVADVLCSIEFSGDENRITGQLHLAAEQLRKTAEQYNEERAESEKLNVAVCASAVGLIIILLF